MLRLDRAQATRKSSGAARIALAVDIYDWHARELAAAFSRAGAALVPVRLAQCSFDTSRPGGLVIPGFGASLPDALFVRAVGSGTFESVTLRLDVLHSLGTLGIPVLNSARAIEVCVDKAATSFALARNHIPTPQTWTVQSWSAACRIVRRECVQGPLVLKPLFGAQGFGLKLIRCEADLPPLDSAQGVYYLQRFVSAGSIGFHDLRLFVLAGRVIAAMTRHSGQWITNVKLGARPERLETDSEMVELALRAADAVGATFAGVDLIRDGTGRLQVLEVNSMPGWRGLQKVTPFSIADVLACHVLAQLGGEQALAAG